MPNYRNITIATIIFTVAFLTRLFVAAGGYYVDDAFIALRIARNLSESGQLVFNLGEYVQSGTSNLYLILLGVAYRYLEEDSLVLFRYLGAVVDSVTATLIFIVASCVGRDINGAKPEGLIIPGIVAGGLYALISTAAIPAAAGLETSFYTFCLLAFVYAYQRNNELLSICFCILCALFRPEGAILAILMYFKMVLDYRKFKSPSILILVILPLIAAVYAIFLLTYFGSLIPQSASAKMLAKALTIGSKLTWFDFFGPHYLSALALPFGALSALGVFAILKFRRDLLIYLIWYVIYVGLISVFSLWWTWYKAPAMTFYVVSIGLGCWIIYLELLKRISRKRASSIILILSCTLFFGVGLKSWASISALGLGYQNPLSNKKIEEMDEVISWVNINVPQDDQVMVEPLGYFGYHVKNKILDYPGLASKKVTEVLRMAPIPDRPVDYINPYAWAIRGVKPSWLILRNNEYHDMLALKNVLNNYAPAFITTAGNYLVLKRLE